MDHHVIERLFADIPRAQLKIKTKLAFENLLSAIIFYSTLSAIKLQFFN